MSKCTLQNTNGNIKGIKLTCIAINIKRSTNKITLIVFSFKIAMSIISFLSQIRFILMITLKSLLQHALLMTFGSLLLTAFTVQAETTVVFLRHGEKPEAPTGQLTCKGFNRALALPSVLLTRFGQPDAIYAAAPKQNKTGSSLRPLSTILPTAIRAEHPVILKYHTTETDGLVSDLLSTSNRQQTTDNRGCLSHGNTKTSWSPQRRWSTGPAVILSRSRRGPGTISIAFILSNLTIRAGLCHSAKKARG